VIERKFSGRLRDGVGFAFVKTNGKPYDVVVVAVLYAMIDRFPEVKFRTDSKADELRAGFDLYVSACANEGSDLLFALPISHT
jgi:hypothetical protein